MSGRDHPGCALHLPSSKADAAPHLSQSLLKPFCKTIGSHSDTDYSFFWRCLQAQEPSVARAHIPQQASDTELALRSWRCSGKASSTLYPLSKHLQTTSKPSQSTCRHPQRSETQGASPGMSSPWPERGLSNRARSRCWLDLPLCPFAVE